MAAGRKKAGAIRNPSAQVQSDAARSGQKKSRRARSMSASDKRIVAFLDAKDARESREAKSERKVTRKAGRSSPNPPPSKVTVRKVEPSPSGQSISLKPPIGTDQVKGPQLIGRSSMGRISPNSREDSEFVPRHLRDAVRGSDGKLRTSRDPKGRPWKS